MDGCYLAQVIKPFLYVNDAEEFNPILMVQVENEYGSRYDVSTKKNDAKYLQYLIDLCRTSWIESNVIHNGRWECRRYD